MSKKNGFVLVDISDGRVMNIGLDTATVEDEEVPGIEVIKNSASRKFLLPMDKQAGNHTIATLDDIPSPSGGGTKLYKHTIGDYEFISTTNVPFTSLSVFGANIDKIISGKRKQPSVPGAYCSVVRYWYMDEFDLFITYYNNEENNQFSTEFIESIPVDTVTEL